MRLNALCQGIVCYGMPARLQPVQRAGPRPRICRQPGSWGMHPHCMVGWALWTHRLQRVAALTVGYDCSCQNV